MSDIRNEVRNVIFVRRSEPDPSEKTPTRIIFSSIKRLTPEEVQRDAIWRLTQGMLAQVNAQPNPVKAAAAVPEDRKAWVRHEVARQIVWFQQFIGALTDGLPEAPPGDHAPIEGGADQR
jgi:hypothetical protein